MRGCFISQRRMFKFLLFEARSLEIQAWGTTACLHSQRFYIRVNVGLEGSIWSLSILVNVQIHTCFSVDYYVKGCCTCLVSKLLLLVLPTTKF